MAIQLTCLPKWQRRKAELQLASDTDHAVDVLLERFFKDMVILELSMAHDGYQMAAGAFGQTEPWPLDLEPE